MTLCIRPAEAVLRVGIMLPFIIHAALNRRKWAARELKYAGVLILICGIAVTCAIAQNFVLELQWLPRPDYKAFSIAMAGLGTAWAVYFFRLRRNVRSFFPLFVLLSSTFTIFWFAAYLKDVLRWSLFCSYHRSTDNSLLVSSHPAGLNVYPDLCKGYIGPLGAVFFATCIIFGRREIFGRGKKSSLTVILAATLLTLAIHTGLGALSYQTVPRFYCLEVTALWMVLAIILMRSQSLLWAKRALIIGLSVFFVLTQLNVYGVIDIPGLNWGKTDFAPFWGLNPERQKEDQAAPLLQALLPAMKEKPDLFGCIYMFPHPPSRPFLPQDMVVAIAPYTEPWTLRLMSLEKNLKFDPKWEYRSFENWVQWRSREGEHFDYCLMGPMEWAKQEFTDQLNQDKSVRAQKFTFHYGEAQSTVLLLKWR